MPPFPRQKIGRIKELAEKSNKPEIGEALGEIYDNIIRNAVYHSDYVLHENSMHLMKDSRFSKEQGCFTPLVTFEELEELINNAFAFYSAFFFLYERCRRLLADFKNMIVPYDLHCKGLLELLFDEEHRLIGFRVYWPNGSCSEYGRSKDASMGVNLQFEKDGSINLFVGRLASNPSKFSPLVEEGDAPNYPVRPDTDIRPHWPQPLAIYRLPLDSGLEDVGT